MQDSLDPVIHQHARLRILTALVRNRRASFTDLRDGLRLTPGNLQSHAARLEAAGYVEARRVLVGLGFEVQYRVTPAGVAAFQTYLRALDELLEDVRGD